MSRLALVSLLVACGAPPAPTPAPAPPPIVAPAAAPSAPLTDPAGTASPLPESCEALARACGGWVGCIHVRLVSESDGLARYEGLGEHAGHAYTAARSCIEDRCNDVCDPATGVCRPGLLEDVPIACSRSTGPSPAPFFCELVDGSCVRHELPPATVHAGPRS